MTMHSTAMASFALALAGAAWVAPALAQSCNDDMAKLGARHLAEMQTVNDLIKAAKGKQIEASVFCEKTRGVIETENTMIAYLEKNKDWCGFPDEMLDNLKASHAKNIVFNGKACKVAAEQKKVQEQAQGGAPQAQPLPAGPL